MPQAYRVKQIGRLYAVICVRTRRIVYATTCLRHAGMQARMFDAAKGGAPHLLVPAPRRPAD